MPIIRSGSTFLRSGNSFLRPHSGNVYAPAIVTPPSEQLWSYTADTQKLQWPLTNNQFDNIVARSNGQLRDWFWTMNGPQHRFGGIRYYWSWLHKGENAYPHWQPAVRKVYNVRRKGTTGVDAQTLVYTCSLNTANIPVGDQVWFLLEDMGYHGNIAPQSTLDIGGYTLNLRQKMSVSRSVASPTGSFDHTTVRSTIEVITGSALPAINYTPPADIWGEPQLRLIHHSFYANAATKTLRHPYDWHFGILKDEIAAAPTLGHVVLGGLQGIPTWRCWTHLFTMGGPLFQELYALECQGLADYFGATDPRYVMYELENEPVYAWNGDAGFQADYGRNIPLRTSLRDIMYPAARTAWGANRSILIKGGGFGGLDALRDEFNLTNADFGGGANFLGNHNYADSAPHLGPGGRQLWYDDGSDARYHADILATKASNGGFKGAAITEFSAPGFWPADQRGRHIGKMHSAAAGRSIAFTHWDLTGDHYSHSWLYSDVPGSEGRLVQQIIPEMRPYCGRSGRSV